MKDTETEAGIIGVQAQMNKFNYFFRVKLAILLLRHSNSFSATLQNPKLSASQTQSITRETFYHLRKTTRRWLFAVSQRNFNWVETIIYWWARLSKKNESVPTIQDCYCCSSVGFFHEKFEGFAQQIYFDVLSLPINAIENRFEQEDYKRWTKVLRMSLKPFFHYMSSSQR